jgi:hypothetical protein
LESGGFVELLGFGSRERFVEATVRRLFDVYVVLIGMLSEKC